MRRISLIFSLLFFAGQARAVITVTGVGGASSWTQVTAPTTPTPGTTTPTTGGGTTSLSIFGGTAGTDCSGAAPTAVCNSCTTTTTCPEPNLAVDQAPLCACNTSRISDNVTISVSIARNPVTSPVPLIHASVGTATGSTELALGEYVGALTTDSVNFRWGAICPKMTSSPASCIGANGTVTMTIWADNKGTGVFDPSDENIQVTVRVFSPGNTQNIFGKQISEGIGKFTPFPGDGKAYITDIDTTTNFPTLSNYGALITAVRVYISDKNMDTATAKDAVKTQDLTVTSGSDTLDQDFIDDLDNGKGYFFRVAMVDQANNAVQFFPDVADLKVAFPQCFAPAADAATCPYGVIPDQVLGLLSKDFNCFVATAAYGSSLEPKLKILRDFRRFILLRHDWGKRFVFSYYQYGPYAARYIADKPVLRAIARGFLWPVFGFSWLALKIGLLNSFLLSLILMSSVLALPWIGLRRLKSA